MMPAVDANLQTSIYVNVNPLTYEGKNAHNFLTPTWEYMVAHTG